MCPNHSVCGGSIRPNRSTRSGSSSSGAHYALCALGVGLIALGIVMIVWTVIPMDKQTPATSTTPSGNTTVGYGDDDGKGTKADTTKSSLVAIVLVGVGAAILLLSICLGVRSKRRSRSRRNPAAAPQVRSADQVAQGQEEAALDPATYSVPSYEEVIGSGNYPVRQSNLRQSTSQLPSYEDIIAAVENEGSEPTNNPTETSPLNDPTPTSTQPARECQADSAGLNSNASLPSRSSSRASRLLRPLRVRRIKSDKLHLKDFRLQIRTPTQNPVTIEPITPPPQYENKMPDLQ